MEINWRSILIGYNVNQSITIKLMQLIRITFLVYHSIDLRIINCWGKYGHILWSNMGRIKLGNNIMGVHLNINQWNIPRNVLPVYLDMGSTYTFLCALTWTITSYNQINPMPICNNLHQRKQYIYKLVVNIWIDTNRKIEKYTYI